MIYKLFNSDFNISLLGEFEWVAEKIEENLFDTLRIAEHGCFILRDVDSDLKRNLLLLELGSHELGDFLDEVDQVEIEGVDFEGFVVEFG